MSIHVCKCMHNSIDEYHLRYPGMSQNEAQTLADRINASDFDMNKEEQLLARFYAVTTKSQLITAQAEHILKLQEKVATKDFFEPMRVREG